MRRLVSSAREDAVIDALIAQNAPRVVWLGDGGATLGVRNRAEFQAAERRFRRASQTPTERLVLGFRRRA